MPDAAVPAPDSLIVTPVMGQHAAPEGRAGSWLAGKHLSFAYQADGGDAQTFDRTSASEGAGVPALVRFGTGVTAPRPCRRPPWRWSHQIDTVVMSR
jgi:hypothetical protein